MRDDTASTRRGFIKGAAAATAVAAGVTGMTSRADSRVPPLFNGITRAGQHPSGSPTNPPPPKYEARREAGLLIERDIAVRLRDGVRIYVDIYRPDGPPGEKDLPVIIGWGPYGKHTVGRTYSRESGVRPEWVSKYTGFEGVNPLYWCPRGYAVLYPNPRGTWHSEGDMHHGGITESMDCYDLIEWAGVQPWCNGKVGMSGVSYLAAIQYQVAPLAPPHLAAINPWEAFSDWYREFAYHGGIRESGFLPYAARGINWSLGRTDDTNANVLAHPLYDEFWESRENLLEDIKVPAFVVASWTDQGFHTRGTLECFRKMRSQQKWLLSHGQKKWGHFYDPENVRQLQTFFDHFLKGTDDTVLSWPKVRIEVRERAYVQVLRAEDEWPLQRQQLHKLYLDAADASIANEPRSAQAEVSYDSQDKAASAHFDYVFAQDTELTGHMKLRLWAAAAEADDMDLFVAIQKIDRNGEHVGFHYYASFDTGPVALGWLRASHRELDAERSTPEQPVHTHRREDRLKPGEFVPMEIEIWASSTLFRAGERLRVLIKGSDVYPYPNRAPGLPLALHEETRNRGAHRVRTGGTYDSHLLVPVIGPKR
jgi:predicted acyl esterase